MIRSIPWRRIRARIEAGRLESICVAATQIATGHVVLFIESSQRELPVWGLDPHLVPRLTHLRPMHALASAAMPLLFPAVRVGSTYYADGGLRLNTPLVPALRLGAERILVIATRQDPSQATEAALADQHLADYSSPFFLYGDYCDFIRLAQYFNAVHVIGNQVCAPVELPAGTRHLDCYLANLLLSDRAYHCTAIGAGRAGDGIAMMAIARGMPIEAMAASPAVITIISVNSPRRFDEAMAYGLMTMAEHGQPVVITPFTLMGAMAPVTLAAALAQQNAEALSAWSSRRPCDPARR